MHSGVTLVYLGREESRIKAMENCLGDELC